MNIAASSQVRWVPLILSLLACPSILLVSTLVLPPFKSFYGTVAEKLCLLGLLVLPFIGVAGIVRYLLLARWAKAAFAVAYVALMILPVIFTGIFIGCSWAGVCF